MTKNKLTILYMAASFDGYVAGSHNEVDWMDKYSDVTPMTWVWRNNGSANTITRRVLKPHISSPRRRQVVKIFIFSAAQILLSSICKQVS